LVLKDFAAKALHFKNDQPFVVITIESNRGPSLGPDWCVVSRC